MVVVILHYQYNHNDRVITYHRAYICICIRQVLSDVRHTSIELNGGLNILVRLS